MLGLVMRMYTMMHTWHPMMMYAGPSTCRTHQRHPRPLQHRYLLMYGWQRGGVQEPCGDTHTKSCWYAACCCAAYWHACIPTCLYSYMLVFMCRMKHHHHHMTSNITRSCEVSSQLLDIIIIIVHRARLQGQPSCLQQWGLRHVDVPKYAD